MHHKDAHNKVRSINQTQTVMANVAGGGAMVSYLHPEPGDYLGSIVVVDVLLSTMMPEG